jgi:hypothetical protein
MNPRRVQFTNTFQNALNSCSSELRARVVEAVAAFINRSTENALRPERKSGLGGIWAFRVSGAVRVFYTQEKDKAGAYSLIFHGGPHDDYRTIERRRPPRRQ